ncbi:GNAT family N-acetyltransferase [Streptomyces pimonensis]|uniref:GNAT family N-acetyltransferase n=1 Tax=Streptomyces pimonensis TaxID=2860288 RepID=A0ABV4IU15_9ACTN
MSSSPEHTPPRTLPEVRGHGLRLRAWDPERRADVETWLRGLTDPEFRRWNTPLQPVTDADGARESLRRGARRDADGTGASFRIADAGTGTVLGHIGVNEIHPVLRRGTVGYWVLPEARGRGVATRALLLAARWAFTGSGLHRLELDHAVGHEASCRIAERCGFRQEGTMRGALFEAGRHDAFRDAHLHARLATDPETVLRATATP